jgi:hypothetical protein
MTGRSLKLRSLKLWSLKLRAHEGPLKSACNLPLQDKICCFYTWESSCTGFHFPKRTTENSIHESPFVLGFIFPNGLPRILYMRAQLYWVIFSQTDNQEFNTWESSCTGFHFPKRTTKNSIHGSPAVLGIIFPIGQLRIQYSTGFNFPKWTTKNSIHGSPVILGFIFPNGQTK